MAFLSTMCPNVLIFIMNWISAGFSCLPVLLTYTVINGYLAPIETNQDPPIIKIIILVKNKHSKIHVHSRYIAWWMIKKSLNIKQSHKFKVNNKKKLNTQFFTVTKLYLSYSIKNQCNLIFRKALWYWLIQFALFV